MTFSISIGQLQPSYNLKAIWSRHGRDLTRSETILALASASSPTEKTSKSDGKPKIEIGAPVINQEYILLEDWQPDGDRDNVLVPMKKGEVSWIFSKTINFKSHVQKVFVIEKTASGWWLAAPAGRMESIIPGYVEARNVFIGPYASNQSDS